MKPGKTQMQKSCAARGDHAGGRRLRRLRQAAHGIAGADEQPAGDLRRSSTRPVDQDTRAEPIEFGVKIGRPGAGSLKVTAAADGRHAVSRGRRGADRHAARRAS